MLWTEVYNPSKLEQILGQENVTRYLSSFAKSRSVPHLVLFGPHGTGKSTAVGCFARELYGESWEANTVVFPAADLFLQGKGFLEQDDRYSHLYQKGQSLINNFKYILKWYASIRPLDAEFKLMVFEDAHALTRDAQAALRRIMEQYSPTCRFVFTTTNQSALIPAITSRCLPLFFAPVDSEIILAHLQQISKEETSVKFPCTGDELELIQQTSQGDMRRAILLLQIALDAGKCNDVLAVTASETTNIAASAINSLRDGETRKAVKQLESLMIEYGISGDEVFSEMRTIIQREYNHPMLAIALADAEYRLQHCNSEYIQTGSFAASTRGVFP